MIIIFAFVILVIVVVMIIIITQITKTKKPSKHLSLAKLNASYQSAPLQLVVVNDYDNVAYDYARTEIGLIHLPSDDFVDALMLMVSGNDWATSEKSLISVLDHFSIALRYCLINTDSESRQIQTLFEQFLTNYGPIYVSRINSYKNFTWNIYAQATPEVLGFYLLLPSDRDHANYAASLILMLGGNPTYALGRDLMGASALRLLGPIYLASALYGRIKELKASVEYIQVTTYIDKLMKPDLDIAGITYDGVYINENNEVDLAKVLALSDDGIRYMYKLDSTITNPTPRILKLKETISHKSIKTSIFGLFPNQHNLSARPYSEYDIKVYKRGLSVLPSISYIRYYTDQHRFEVKGVVPNQAYYSGSAPHNYWTQYRNVHTPKSLPVIKFPDVGFITLVGEVSAPKIDTTLPCITKSAMSGVFIYKGIGYLVQQYLIPRFGNYSVTELIVINPKENTITCTTTISNTTDHALNYHTHNGNVKFDKYRDLLSPSKIDSKTKQTFKQTFNLASGIVTCKKVDTALEFPITTGNIQFSIKDHNYIILYDDKLPKIIVAHTSEYNAGIIPITINDTVLSFMYDEETKQYQIM